MSYLINLIAVFRVVGVRRRKVVGLGNGAISRYFSSLVLSFESTSNVVFCLGYASSHLPNAIKNLMTTNLCLLYCYDASSSYKTG
jgi:hypothetical protein